MDVIIINEKKYVCADYILQNAPIFCKGVRSSRDLIRKKNINKDDYVYSRFIDNKWVIMDGKSVKFDKVLILESYVLTIPELTNIINVDEKIVVVDDNGIMEAPHSIYLEEHEKFKNSNNEVFDIEVRGTRNVDDIYFKVKDVEKAFDMVELGSILIKENTLYTINNDYKYFMCKKDNNVPKKTSKAQIKKTLFLTYCGLLRVLFVSRNNKTAPFIKWAVETLFTVHLGNNVQKDNLISKIKGVSYASIQELFNVNSKSLPCVYLTYLNSVKSLRSIMNINSKYNDEDCVYKFGLTSSFETRKYGHKQEFKDIENNIDLKLVQFAFIDPLYLSKAELDIKKLFEENSITYKNYSEIIILSKKELNYVKNAYELIATKYSGHNTSLIKENEQLHNKLEHIHHTHEQLITNLIKENNLKCEYIINEKNNECNYKLELLKQSHINEIQILKKDFELDLLKKELQFMKSNK